jgi:hypothetical protein
MRWFDRFIPVDLRLIWATPDGCNTAAASFRARAGSALILTRFLPQISLRNLRKLDCYANRRPLRSKTLLNYQQRIISPPNR